MKRILLCLMMYGSCAHAVLIRMSLLGDLTRFRTMGSPQQWARLGLLFHRFAFKMEDLLDEAGNPIFPAAIVRAEELPQFAMILPLQQVDQPDDEHKDQRRAQKLEARENTKRAWLASRHHDKHLPKKNKWVCQQPCYNKNNH